MKKEIVCDRNCPNRSAECKRICEKWQEYEKRHFEEREHRAKNREIDSSYAYYIKEKKERLSKGRLSR